MTLPVALLAIGWVGAERVTHAAYRPDKRSLAEFPQLQQNRLLCLARWDEAG